MTLDDLLYQLGDSIGWDHCDYARDKDGHPYGITNGHATIALTLDGDTTLWCTYAATEDGPDTLGEGECPADDMDTLIAAWREAAAIARPHEERVARVVARLIQEGWAHDTDGDTHILHGGRATVTVAPDGEVSSDDPMARLYVHAAYAPEEYGVYPA